MSNIKVLDQYTINKIAAGEVIDRPASVVKELLENAIDAKSKSITIEIKDGGTSLIRITDDGIGIAKSDIPLAFLRHSTSKITDALDLLTVSSLGFRGEALSSIAAISQVELISKPASQLTATRYIIEGGSEKQIEDIGAPNGTTFIVRNLFYNTPARRKFLKSPSTEASYISNIIERIALSHPEISIRFINNNSNKLFTSGNNNLKNIIYNVYGKEPVSNIIALEKSSEIISLYGYIGKPEISRGNRDYEIFFINGRYIRSSLISAAIEEAYKPFFMQNKYPFTILHITIDSNLLDINVHPSKMEIRIEEPDIVYNFIRDAISEKLNKRENIPQVRLLDKGDLKNTVKKETKISYPEPFETKRQEMVREEAPYNPQQKQFEPIFESKNNVYEKNENVQMEIFNDNFLSSEGIKRHKIIGQVFSTYWLVEYEEKLFIIDQHAAHEKVLYERLLVSLNNKEIISQNLAMPLIVSLSMLEEELLLKYMDEFKKLGFEIEHFGGSEYAIRAVPANLFSINSKDLFITILDNLSYELSKVNNELIVEKIAALSCKASVKGNQKLSYSEVDKLIKELLTLENPYNCPHGRPTIISMSKSEMEKKFKRIV